MRLRRVTVTWLLILAAVGLVGATGALAAGPSAGDQQYVDPLASSTTPSSHSSTPSSSSSSSSSSTSPSSSGTVTPTVSASTTASAGTTASANQSSAGTLPRTGMDSWLAAAIGAALVGTGLALRRQALHR